MPPDSWCSIIHQWWISTAITTNNFLWQLWKYTWLVQTQASWHTVTTKTSPYHKLDPASNFAKFVWACEPCEMASVTETLSSSLWECKSKSWEMKARLGTQRTLRPHRGRINTAWFKSNGPRPARSQTRIRDTGLISPRSGTHDTSSYFKTSQQCSKSILDRLLFFTEKKEEKVAYSVWYLKGFSSQTMQLQKKEMISAWLWTAFRQLQLLSPSSLEVKQKQS